MGFSNLQKKLVENQIRLEKAIDGSSALGDSAISFLEVAEKFFHSWTMDTSPTMSRVETLILAHHLDSLLPDKFGYETIIDSPCFHPALKQIRINWDEKFIKVLASLLNRIWQPERRREQIIPILDLLTETMKQNPPRLRFGRLLLEGESTFLNQHLAGWHMSYGALILEILQNKYQNIHEIAFRLPVSETFWDTLLAEYSVFEAFKLAIKRNDLADWLMFISTVGKSLNRSDSVMILVSYLILQMANTHAKIQQDIVMHRIAEIFKIDMEKPWRLAEPSRYLSEHHDALQMAYKILLSWLNNRLIQGFFDNLAIDKDRALFWKDQTDIEEVTIFVPEKSQIERVARMGIPRSFLVKRVRVNYNLSEASLAAILMETKNHILVDFSTNGHAFYAYLKTSSYCPNPSRNLTLDELKRTELRYTNAIEVNNGSWGNSYEKYHTNPEGRAFHKGDWQPKFRHWLKKYLR